MANEPGNAHAPLTPPSGEGQAGTNVRVVAQYIKDLSFENPNLSKLLHGVSENPNVEVNIGVSSNQLGPNLYESVIEFRAKTISQGATLYDLECLYAGLFQVENMPPQMLETFLLINCPALVFPYLRRLVADLTREGGFPPLVLDPIDFAGLYMRRQQELAAS